jgi:hypothetical protein
MTICGEKNLELCAPDDGLEQNDKVSECPAMYIPPVRTYPIYKPSTHRQNNLQGLHGYSKNNGFEYGGYGA